MMKENVAILNIKMFLKLQKVLKSVLNILLMLALQGCALSNTKMQPCIEVKPLKCDIMRLPSAFDALTCDELMHDWAKELLVGQKFAKELDYYRAITAFKRALIFISDDFFDRRAQIEYCIIESYYLAGKYCEAVQEFESSSLLCITADFPAFRNLLIMMHDSYLRINEYDKSEKILNIIQKAEPSLAQDLQLSLAIREGRMQDARQLAGKKIEPVEDFINNYCFCSLSPRKAQLLNAILPGAGYYYVGQKKAATTSFLINALFIGATYYFFDNGNWPAGLITLSLETGWYVGGINGAGLEAKAYNEQLYNTHGKGLMIRNDLFPFLMIETSF